MSDVLSWSTDSHLIIVAEDSIFEIKASMDEHPSLLEQLRSNEREIKNDYCVINVEDVLQIRAAHRRKSCELKYGLENERSLIAFEDYQSRDEFVAHVLQLAPADTWIEEKTHEKRARSATFPALCFVFSAFISWTFYMASMQGTSSGEIATFRRDKQAIADLMNAAESILGATGIAVIGVVVTLASAIFTVYLFLYPGIKSVRFQRSSPTQ